MNTIELENMYQVPTYPKWPMPLVKGEGCTVWDDQGNEYLDLYGGHCVALIGHSHPVWAEAIAEQARIFGFYSNVCATDSRARYQQKLIEFAPEHLSHVFLCNSGTEANETAIKLAMKTTGRTDIIAMKGGFHGRTAGSLSVTHLGHYREQFPAVVRETTAVDFGDLDALRGALDFDVAAVILEPIQSMNAMSGADTEYFQGLVALCQDNGALVIFDEIQTGFGRLGASFAAEYFEAPADIVTCAKGMGNGFPMGGVLVTEEVAINSSFGEQGTTFGGGPMACAAGSAVLDVLAEENLIEHVKKTSNWLQEEEALICGPVVGLKGAGYLIGLETSIEAKDVAVGLRDRGILAGSSFDPNVLRLMPPLTAGRKEFERLIGALKEIGEQ